MGCEDNKAENLFKAELVTASRHDLGKPAIVHQDYVPNCWSSSETLDGCMEVGFGTDGRDCSSLVICAFTRAFGTNTRDWRSDLRHARQMNTAMRTAGAMVMPLELASKGDIGNLVFSERWIDGLDGPARFFGHVAVLSDFTGDGRPIVVHASSGVEGLVVERPPIDRADRERFVMDSSVLAELALPLCVQG